MQVFDTRVVVACGMLFFSAVAFGQGKIYWGAHEPITIAWMYAWGQSPTRVFRANLDGSSPEWVPLAGQKETVHDFAFDATAGVMYWASADLGQLHINVSSVTEYGRIHSTVLDTTESRTIYATGHRYIDMDVDSHILSGAESPSCVALDHESRKVYWGMSGSGILRCDPDGGKMETVVEGDETDWVADIAIDAAGGRIYWCSGGQQIMSAGLEGGDVKPFMPAGKPASGGQLAVDAENRQLYWVEHPGRIMRADLSGGRAGFLARGDHVRGLALDVRAGKMYWSEQRRGIFRANLDGTGAERIVPPGKLEFEEVALLPEEPR